MKTGGCIDGLGGFKEAQGYVPVEDAEKYLSREDSLKTRAQRRSERKKEHYAQNAQYGRCDFEIDLETGAVSLKKNTMKERQIVVGLTRGFENGIGFSYLEDTLRNFLENPGCGSFEITKFKHPKDPKYPQLNELIVSIENYPPKPANELAPY